MIEKIINNDIENISEFRKILDLICNEIDNGNIEQFVVFEDLFCTKDDIHLFINCNKYPDYIRCYFKDKNTDSEYLLAVETFHGIGGSLKKIK